MNLASWAVLGRVLGLSWDVLEGSWADLRPSWASWAGRSATRGFLERLGGLLGSSSPVLEPSWLRKIHATRRGGAQGARDKPREILQFWLRSFNYSSGLRTEA